MVFLFAYFATLEQSGNLMSVLLFTEVKFCAAHAHLCQYFESFMLWDALRRVQVLTKRNVLGKANKECNYISLL
jgi:hypothetical protein